MKAFITIISAPGEFLKVRQRIRNISFDERVKISNCYDVTGFCDIIVETAYEGSLEGFFEDVVDVINKISEVNKLTTYLVYAHSTEKSTEKPISGYIFIGAIPSQITNVYKELSKLQGIVSSNIVSGEYDIIGVTTVPLAEMPEFISKIQNISGLKWSRTCISQDVFRALKGGPQV